MSLDLPHKQPPGPPDVCGTPSMLRAPDDAACCWGAVMGTACTCWREVLVPTPNDDVQEGPNPVQRSRCGDCAYRRDSPERADETPLPDAPEHPFWCHAPRDGKTAGMPLVVAYVHEETGERQEVPHGDSYQPFQRGGRTWNADGTPGTLCRGWAAAAGMVGGTT